MHFLATMILVLVTMNLLFRETLENFYFAEKDNIIEVDENLPNFFSAIKLSDAEWFCKESNYLKNRYHFTFANKIVVDRMEKIPVPSKAI